MSLSKKFIGIKDLLDEQRYRIQHLQDELIKQNVPGSNWYSYQNVYNLVNGAYPNDAYVFVFLSDFLNIDVKIILMRYSILEISKNDTAVDLGELKYQEKWYDIL